QVFPRFDLRVETRVRQECRGEPVEPRLAGNHCLGTALGLVRQVQVFEALLRVGRENGRLQLARQLALFLDALEDRFAALVELAQVAEPLLERAQLRIVETFGRLLTIAGDEGDGGACIQQGNGSRDLLRLDGELRRETCFDRQHRQKEYR